MRNLPLKNFLYMMTLEQFTAIDLTHMLSGAYSSMFLADLGAKTIKAAANQNHAMLGNPK